MSLVARCDGVDTHAQRRDLLRVLHPVGYRDLRALRKGDPPRTANVHATDFVAVDEFATKYRDRNIYVGVAPRADATGRELGDCLALHALFVDQDFKDVAEPDARARWPRFHFRRV